MLADPAELSGVFNKALLAMAAIRQHGFTESESTRQAMDDFRQTTDPLAVWLDRHTVVHPDAVVVADRLWASTTAIVVAKGRPTISKNALGRAIVQLRTTVEKLQRTINGVLSWCYVGIGLVAKEAE